MLIAWAMTNELTMMLTIPKPPLMATAIRKRTKPLRCLFLLFGFFGFLAAGRGGAAFALGCSGSGAGRGACGGGGRFFGASFFFFSPNMLSASLIFLAFSLCQVMTSSEVLVSGLKVSRTR